MRLKTIPFLIFILLFVFEHPSLSAEEETIPSERTEINLEIPPQFCKGIFCQERALTAPPGFKVSVFASGLERPRFMAFDANGTLFVSLPHEGKVIALPDKNKDGIADEVIVFAEGLNRPHGLAFRGKDLVVAETGSLVQLKDKNGDLKADSKKTITEDIPSGVGHWTRTVVVGPDKKLYVSAGSSCDLCMEKDKRRASVLRFSNSKAEIFATGLRNSVGIAFDPKTKELWGVDNGRDMMGEDVPPEELNRIVKGGDYGWPYCWGDRELDPEFGTEEKCKGTIPPVVKMQAHSAPLGITFGYGLKFPKAYTEGLYVSFHGSWNRTVPVGYKLSFLPFKNGRPTGTVIDILAGWHIGGPEGETWGRPVYPVVGKDGALYLSDDYNGSIYRISYEGGSGTTNRMLKKSVLDFFNYDLAEVNSSKSHKLLDF